MKGISLLNAAALLGSQTALAHPIDESAAELALRQVNPLNPFLALVTNVPPVSLLVNGAAGTLTNLEGLLVPLSGGPTNQNDIASGKPCAAMTLIFARGTTEPGNMGVVAGPQLVNAIKKAMPGTTLNVQGVNYTATIQGYLAGGGQDGTASMSGFLQQTAQQCPQSKVVLAGYSQGGQVVHNTAKAVGAAGMAQVNSVVIFGDPQSKTPVTGAETKTLVICHDGDNICSNGDLILPPHLTYGFDSPQAGAFVAQMAGGAAGAAAAAPAAAVPVAATPAAAIPVAATPAAAIPAAATPAAAIPVAAAAAAAPVVATSAASSASSGLSLFGLPIPGFKLRA